MLTDHLADTFGDDGVFWISYKDFLKHFARINRVRLFDESWSVSQQWTCVSVPWTVDYLDTHFQFTVTKKGPVAIVLCQPDDRFFHGLSGRYVYSLHLDPRAGQQWLGLPTGWGVRTSKVRVGIGSSRAQAEKHATYALKDHHGRGWPTCRPLAEPTFEWNEPAQTCEATIHAVGPIADLREAHR